MERDPRNTQAAAEEAAAPAEGEPTDGVHAAAETDEVPVAPADPDGAAAGGAAAAGVKQAEDDAPAPQPRPEAPAAEPDYRDQYLRAMAEIDNVRKRARRDVAQAEARGIAKLARELLPAIDNFGRALDAAEAQPENRDHHLTDGIRLVQNELLSALARVGIEQDSPQGEPFDPHCHEAIAQQPVEGTASGTIVEVYSQGYRYRDDVLRPAKVVVAA
ncbi:MAG: molecular chaperone GrpE [Solirubrobacteraceae bacterium]|jgi:molecular chaperone GrpE|nr:molecular chaperone GrpE [Solirubrobacteraceae bacterium]